MCGIAGIIGHADAYRQVKRMTATLAHRGPDGAGAYLACPNAALGHSRLAVMDLSASGAQPMTSRDGRWTIVLNGEIFNYRELRKELAGLPWRSTTDTEVLLEACAAWGIERALNRSIGMFAVGLWDAREQELTLARDRMGEKPLLYFEDHRSLAFASEMKALRDFHGGYLDPDGVEVYLGLGYVPAPLAIFRNIRKLQAGHRLRWKNGHSTIDRWWFPERAGPVVERTAAGRIEKAHGLLADAVGLRLRADVPLALALSGGLDSSVVAAEAVRQGAKLDAFTVIAPGDETDLPYACSLARRHGLRHEVVRMFGDVESIRAGIEQCVEHYDEPFADSSAVCSLSLAQALAGRYKVMLNGDGGDEAFAGYGHYTHIAVKQKLKAAAARLGIVDGKGATSVYVQSRAVFRQWESAELMNGHIRGGALCRLLTADQYLQASPGGNALKRALWTDRHLGLSNGLTHKTDIALAAYGVEGRAPFLDHRILEWTQGLASDDLVRGRERKTLLRAAYRDELPPEILTRSKHGFGAPVNAWLAGPLAELVQDALPCPLLEARLQRAAGGQRLWALLIFAQWARRWGARW